MQVFGLMVVRNEADILTINVRHHRAVGVDRFLIIDNGSTDGTDQILRNLSQNGLVEWTRDPGSYRQAEMTTELAREAWRQGADWVIPIDADEFWCAPAGDLRSVLENSSAGAIQVEVLNFIQRRDQVEATPGGLLSMTRRAALPAGPLEQVRELVEAREFAYVEAMYSPKFISRPAVDIRIAMGNHGVSGVAGPIEATDEIVCFHAALRARAVLEAKVEHGARVAELGLGPEQGWHVRRWLRVAEEGLLEKEWLANSYADNYLDVYGVRHPVVFDPRLRDLIASCSDYSQAGSSGCEHAELLRTIHEQLNAHRRESQRLLSPLRRQAEQQIQAISDLQRELHIKVVECNNIIAALQHELEVKVSERDRTILGLREELQTKVGERDQTIRGLQDQLVAEVTERDRTILGLQEELQAKVGGRDQTIRELQARLVAEVTERDRTILGLQEELQARVGERDQTILGLQDQLVAEVTERDRTILGLQEEVQAKVGERDQTIRRLQAQLVEKAAEQQHIIGALEEKVAEQNRMLLVMQEDLHSKVAERDSQIAAVRQELEDIRSSTLWPLFDLLRRKRAARREA